MTETKASTISTWAMAASIHLALVGLSLVLTLVVAQGVGLMPGEVLECMAIGFLLVHALAAVVGLCIRKVSIRSCFLVFAIAFFPAGLEGIGQIYKAIHLRYYAPHDRFRDHLASPVPKSVSSLRFVSLEEGINTDLMFQFDIDPSDMDEILKRLKLERVDPNKMLNPKDFFQHPYYMPIEGDYHVFQGKVGNFDEVSTIKTNEPHSHAIYRLEGSAKYLDKRWENGNPTIIRMDNDALDRMKRKYESAQRERGAEK